MDGMIIVILVCLQLVSFFFIIILFAKLNKFKELERKQEQIVTEMDAALGAYLMEMKEENDRFIQQLATIPKPEKVVTAEANAELSMKPKVHVPVQPVPKFVSPTVASTVYKTNIEKQSELEEAALLTPNSTVVAAEAEEKQATGAGQAPIPQEELTQVKELSFEEMVVEMYKDGQTIEDIAKNLDKGKTEIELLIKFHT